MMAEPPSAFPRCFCFETNGLSECENSRDTADQTDDKQDDQDFVDRDLLFLDEPVGQKDECQRDKSSEDRVKEVSLQVEDQVFAAFVLRFHQQDVDVGRNAYELAGHSA